MGAPQIIIIILWTIAFTLNAIKHGKPKNENYNVFVSLIGIIIIGSLLYWGGFFG